MFGVKILKFFVKRLKKISEPVLKNKIIFSFVKFMVTKKGKTTLLLLFFFAIVGSGYRDQGSGIEKIRIHNTGYVSRKYFVKLLYFIHEHLFPKSWVRISSFRIHHFTVLEYPVTLTRLSSGEDAPSRVRSLRALAALKLSRIYFLSGRSQSIIETSKTVPSGHLL